MGYSSPKKPFDLAEFLSQKSKPQASRRASWNRRRGVKAKGSETQTEREVGAEPDVV